MAPAATGALAEFLVLNAGNEATCRLLETVIQAIRFGAVDTGLADRTGLN